MPYPAEHVHGNPYDGLKKAAKELAKRKAVIKLKKAMHEDPELEEDLKKFMERHKYNPEKMMEELSLLVEKRLKSFAKRMKNKKDDDEERYLDV